MGNNVMNNNPVQFVMLIASYYVAMVIWMQASNVIKRLLLELLMKLTVLILAHFVEMEILMMMELVLIS